MKVLSLVIAVMTLATGLLLSACGGGVEDVSLPTTSGMATVSGVASKGLFTAGRNNVIVYSADSRGEKGALRATTSTNSQGHYTAVISNNSGPVIIEATGSYLDEASGQSGIIDSSAPLHAALPCDCVTLNVAVTPLTELAYQKARAAIAGGADVATVFGAANTQVSGLFYFDITATQPVDPAPVALQAAANDQRVYALTLAAISQMVKDTGGTVASVITSLNSAGNSAPAQVATALTTFLNSNANNQTGYKGVSLSMSLTGVTSTNVGALDVTIDLPAGTAIPADATGTVSPINFTLTGDAASAFFSTNYVAAAGAAPAKLRISIATLNPLANGQFATIRCAVPNQAGAFVVNSATAKDSNGMAIAGVGVTVQ
jgi:hypothetical protein